MKRWHGRLACVSGLALAGCAKKPVEAPNPSPFYRWLSAPTDPKLVKYPLAETMPDRPGFARSPYTGAVVDVTAVHAGGLAKDPSMAGDPHYFRVP